ncbi:MAG: SsrA-binding protein SmpB [Candidatus Firestonebacteria bacterium]|nr:SsrA-binding protein SmpB [Candidatus Firestonebacteria bacterium]
MKEKPTEKKVETITPLVSNRQARHAYEILETFETGMELVGCEVKSLRAHQAVLQDSYALIKNGEMVILNLQITPYPQGNRQNPDPTRSRRLLMHKHEITRLAGKVAQKGLTLVPLSIYLKGRHVKLELALARGRHTFDKKEVLKERDIKRESDRQLRGKV